MGSPGVTIVALLWTSLLVIGDCLAAWSLVEQWRSSWFAVTTGHVDQSDLVAHQEKDNTSYSARVSYTYFVGSQPYQSKRYRFLNDPSDLRETRRIVANYPKGKEIRVYYDPRSPARAVLDNSFDGRDSLVLLFLLPFHCVSVAFGLVLLAPVRQKLFHPPAAGIKMVETARETRVRLGAVSPSFAAVVVIGAAGLFSTLVLAAALDNRPSGTAVWAACGVAAGLGALAAFWAKVYSGNHNQDLVIDEVAHKLTLPAYCGRSGPIVVDFGEISRVAVVQIRHQTSKGGIENGYRPVLLLNGGRCHDLVEFSQQWKAKALSRWLTDRIHLRAGEIPAEMDDSDDAYRTIIA